MCSLEKLNISRFAGYYQNETGTCGQVICMIDETPHIKRHIRVLRLILSATIVAKISE